MALTTARQGRGQTQLAAVFQMIRAQLGILYFKSKEATTESGTSGSTQVTNSGSAHRCRLGHEPCHT